MSSKQFSSKQGVIPRAARSVAEFLRCGWMFELWGLLVLSVVFQWWGPYIWNPKTVEAVVSGISSIPLLGAMLYLSLAVSALWFVAAIFDIDEYYLPVLDWFLTTVRTYTIAVAAVVFGSVWPWTWSKATAINLVAIVVGGIWCAVIFHTVNDRRNHLQTTCGVVVKIGWAVLANCVLAALAVFSVWLLQVYPQLLDSVL
ncbi:hypothetical protein [Stenotrophomonas sp. Ker107b]